MSNCNSSIWVPACNPTDWVYDTLADLMQGTPAVDWFVRTKGCLSSSSKGEGIYRIYSAAGYAVDYPGQTVDIYGGAVTLANGNIAVLQPVNNIINYSQFSVDITGVAVADTMLVACHQFADDNKYSVVNSEGIVYWQNANIELNDPRDVDLTGTSIRMDVNSGTTAVTYNQPIMFTVKATNAPIAISPSDVAALNTTYSSFFKKLSHRVPNTIFGQYNGGLVKIIGTERDVDRGGNPLSFLNKQESFTIGRRGQLEQPIYKGYEGTISNVTVYPREVSQFHFKCPNLQLEGVASFTFLQLARSNCKISGLVITEGSVWPSSVREVIQALNCAKLVLEDWDCLAMPLGTTSAGGIYCFTGTHIVDMQAQRLRGNTGWGFSGCNFLKNVTFTDNSINRIDCHWGAYDITVNNNRLINWGCLLAGGGTFTAKDNEYHITGPLDAPIGESIVRAFLEVRPDYGAEWDGDIYVDGLTYIIDPAYIADIGANEFDVIRMRPSPNNVDFGRPMYHGHNVSIKNVVFRMDGTQQDNVGDTTLSLNCLNYDLRDVAAQDQYFPHTIVIDNITTTHPSDKVKITAYIPPNYLHPTTRALYPAVDVAAGDFNQKVSITNINAGRHNYTGDGADRGLVRFTLDWSLATLGTYPAYLTDTQAIRPLIEVHNCQGAELCLAVVGNCKVFNSEIKQLQTRTYSAAGPYGPNASQIFISCYDSSFRLTSSKSGSDTWEVPDETWAYNCDFNDLVNRAGGANAVGDADKFKGKGNRKIAATTAWTSTTPFLFDGENAYITGSGTPVGSVVPEFIGQIYKDTSTGNGLYNATGITSSDWKQSLYAGDSGIGIDSVYQAYSDWLLVPWSIGGKYAIDTAATNRPAGITAGFYVAETIGFAAGTALIRPAGSGNIYHVRVDNPLTAPTFSVIQEIQKVGDFGIGITDLPDLAVDANTLDISGSVQYLGAGSTNMPFGLDGLLNVVGNNANNNQTQLFFRQGDNRAFLRAAGNGVFNDWDEILTTGNLSYLRNTSGGTFASNATVAGSSLTPAQTGTWRNVSGVAILNNGYGLWRKV